MRLESGPFAEQPPATGQVLRAKAQGCSLSAWCCNPKNLESDRVWPTEEADSPSKGLQWKPRGHEAEEDTSHRRDAGAAGKPPPPLHIEHIDLYVDGWIPEIQPFSV